MNKKKQDEADLIIEGFGETLTELAISGKITQEQFKLILDTSQEKIKTKLDASVQEQIADLEILIKAHKSQNEYDKKN